MSPQRPTKRNSVFDRYVADQQILLDYIGDDPPLSEREIVERALLLTLSHPKAREVTRAIQLTMRLGSHGESVEHMEQRIENPSVLPTRDQVHMSKHKLQKLAKKWRAAMDQVWWDSIAEQRRWFRSSVQSIVENPRTARKTLAPFINAARKEIAVVSRLTWNDRWATTDIYYHCVTTDAVMAYALMRILDEKTDLSKALQMCKYEFCDRLFLAFPPPGGGPRPKYCKPDHKLDSDRLTGAERTERWRRKKAKKRGKKS